MAILILAAAELFRRGKFSVSFDIVGEPAMPEDKIYLKEIKKLAESFNFGKAVRFLGPKYYWELPEIYRSHNIFVHASKTGSLDKAVLEALACGVNIFTSSEAYDNLLSFIVKFRLGDYMDLASKMEAAFAEKRLGVNEHSVKWIEKNFDLKRLINKILNFYGINE